MTSSNNPTVHAVRRRLGFLKTFGEKIEGLKRELERLEQAARQNEDLTGKWPTDGMERIARGLLVAEKSYQLLSVAGWAKQVLTRLESIRQAPEPPTTEDFDYLKIRIEELVQLRREEEREALEGLELAEGKDERTTESEQGDRSFSSGERAPFDSLYSHKTGNVVVSAGVVVRDPTVRKKVVFALSNAGFEVQELSAGAECVAVIQNLSPDLVVLDLEDPEPGGRVLFEQLRADPLTDAIPILRIGLPLGKTEHDGLPKPLAPSAFVAKARALTTGAFAAQRGQGGPLSNITLDELCDFVASEVRAGLTGSATGDHTAEPFGMPGEAFVVASIWQLVGRLRRFATQGSKGRLHFKPAARPRLDLLETDSPRLAAQEDRDYLGSVDEEDLARLAELSVVVADDDPDVRNHFEQVLEDARMSVRTVPDGQAALVAIGENPPDLVLTDILMPELDGWELCNRLRRDYASKHIPIVLLSWKEDFLQRVQELHAGADDYMLKELEGPQILRRIARVLKPRLTLEKKLESNEVVTGRIERLGVLPLLFATMQRRPNCRLTLRENWSFFELIIAGGELRRITRTGTDGSTAEEGIAALERFLGVSSGRFSVVDSTEDPPNQFPDGTWNAVGAATECLDRLTDQVADGALVGIKHIDLNSRVLRNYKKIAPPKLKGALDLIVGGDMPRSLIVSGKVSPELLERLLLDLIRMGAVVGITSTNSNPPLSVNAPLIGDDVDVHSLGAEIESAFTHQHGAAKKDLEPGAGAMEPDFQDALGDERNTTGPVRMGSTRKGPWPTISAALLAALAVMTYVYFAGDGKKTGQPQTTSSEVAGTAAAATPTGVVDTGDATEVAAESTDTQGTDTKPEEAAASQSADQAGKDIHAPEEKFPEPSETKSQESSRRQDKKNKTESTSRHTRRSEKKNDESKPTKKKRGAESGHTKDIGVLAISVPSGKKGLIKVIVDGKARGTAPLRVKLKPGLHELVLEVNGKKSMRMVPISKGKTKRIAAKFSRD